MTRLAASKVYEEFSDTLDRVAEKKERIVLHRRGRNVAVLIPIEDLALLEELEDRLDAEEAERRLADPTDAVIPYEQIRRELGLA
jgi:prevent-host-death family protein